MQLLLMEDQHVVKALSSDTQEKTFTDGIGAFRMVGCFENLDAARCCYSSETGSKLVIVIANEILRRLPIRSCLSQVLCGPRVGRRACHTDMGHLREIVVRRRRT